MNQGEAGLIDADSPPVGKIEFRFLKVLVTSTDETLPIKMSHSKDPGQTTNTQYNNRHDNDSAFSRLFGCHVTRKATHDENDE
jgi:hypothetical protein